jgi:hypothetical protein
VFERYCGYGFAGPEFVSDRTSVTGPYLPKNFVHPLAALRNRTNPFNVNDAYQLFDWRAGPVVDPVTERRAGAVDTFRGGNARPFRPPPTLSIFDPPGTNQQAQGLYIPNSGLRRIIGDIDKGSHDQNFRQEELAWNRGASQQQTKELKELYLDFELFDGALWGRLGKQTIVWGKTELFRNQDRWNPTDIGLGPLASLEESRVSLWSARLIYMLYDVGPLRDVRIETALVMQDFEPFDLGQCGEALLPRAICGVRLGLFGHGFSALGLAGQIRPPDPWTDTSGFEPGVRVEFRWDRFSFAITDYYGYQDTPTPVEFYTYERNVDPVSGRPRRERSRGPCITGQEADCLGVYPFSEEFQAGDPLPDGSIATERTLLPVPGQQEDVLLHHAANQQLFAYICAGTLGTIPDDIDMTRSTCAQTIFNSPGLAFNILPIAPGFANLMAGNLVAKALAFGIFVGIQKKRLDILPILELNTDPCDRFVADPNCPTTLSPNQGTPPFDKITRPDGTTIPLVTLNTALTDQQEALLGCGAFYGTNCELDGIDLLNMEASVAFQSWTGFSGTVENIGGPPGTQTTLEGTQPGTMYFAGGPVATRYERGRSWVIAGARGFEQGMAQTGYDPRVDGCVGSSTDLLARGITGYTGSECDNARRLVHPQNELRRQKSLELIEEGLPPLPPVPEQIFRSEMAAVSWNLQMVILVLGALAADDPENPGIDEFNADFEFREDGCSYTKPYLCDSVQGFSRWTGNQHPNVRAGGNGRYGRRDFLWHGGTPLVLEYQKNNVFGFAMDFTEDVTGTSWGVEFSWANDVLRQDNGQFDGLTEVDQYNLTISVDRPTFVHFLNTNRSLFFNAQLFVGYESGYNQNFPSNGPWNTFGTFTVLTGYLQDRLNPSITTVYDVESNSGGILPNVQYRFTDNFSVSFGAIFLWGRYQEKPLPIAPPNLTNQVADGPFRPYQQLTEQFIAAARDLDQFTLRIRYTF